MVDFHSSEIFSVIGSISESSEEEGYVQRFDSIEFEGRVWLVPSWIEALDGTHKLPERIVGLPPGALSEAVLRDDLTVRYIVDDPIPMSVLKGSVSKRGGYTVIEQPNVRVQFGTH